MQADVAPDAVCTFSTGDLSAPVSVAPPTDDQELSPSTQTNPKHKTTYRKNRF